MHYSEKWRMVEGGAPHIVAYGGIMICSASFYTHVMCYASHTYIVIDLCTEILFAYTSFIVLRAI